MLIADTLENIIIMDREKLCNVCGEITKYSCCSCGENLCNRPSCSEPVDECDNRYQEEEFCISKCKSNCIYIFMFIADLLVFIAELMLW